MRSTKVAIAASALALGAFACGGGGGGCETGEQVETDEGLVYEDTECGSGAEAGTGDSLVVHYTGKFQDGSTFDSSVDRGDPIEFVLGSGDVIEGWDIGLEGMKVGGKRILTIPPELGYGPSGSPPLIPPDATLTFEVELLEVDPAGG